MCGGVQGDCRCMWRPQHASIVEKKWLEECQHWKELASPSSGNVVGLLSRHTFDECLAGGRAMKEG